MAHDPTGDGIPQIITLRSSAGSGKTYQLAAHYLKVLLTSALEDAVLQTRMANIVAITFTNKAAGEMRSRIIDWMKRIILDIPFENSPVKPLDDIMRDITMIVPGEDTNTIPGTGNDAHDTHLRIAKVRQYLIDAMDRRFSELLKEFGHFNVGTIDSFINLTLKASAMRLDLPPDFEVSMETRDLIDLVLQECLQMAAEDPRAQRIIDTFLEEYIELEGDRTNWLPIGTLRSTILSLWNQEAKENREFHVPRDRSRRMAATIRREMTHKAQCLLDNAVTRNLSLQKNFINALGKCCDPHQDVPLTSAFFSKDLDGCLKKGSLQPDDADLRLWEDLKGKRAPYVEALAASRFTPHLDVYAFFKEIFRKEIILLRSIVPIDQLNRLLQGIVNTADFVPEIYYTLSERYLHFLIDEFQDTSLLQWKNIEILAEEALSRGGSLFLVGDKKQAIYRWRGGDPNIVEQIAGKYKGQYPVARLNLDTNYRSTEQIVFFNNAVFNDRNLLALARATLPEHDPASLAGLCATYENSQQNFLESRKGTGYVAIERVTDPYNPDDDAFTREKANQFIEEKIKGLLAEIRNRGVYRDKDIAILVRTRDEAQTIVNILLSMDVSVESEYTVSIRNNAIIREVISLLKCIDRPDDNKSFASFITGRTFAARYASRSADVANWLENMYLAGKHGPLYTEFKKLFPEIWDTGFEALVRKAGYLPLYDFLIDCIRHWEILINFPGDAPFLLHFLELAKNLENTDKNTLTAFTAFFEDTGPGPGNENTDNEKPFLLTTADSLDAVRVLTIHKAKGLQFPVVILPFITLAPLKLSGSDRQLFFQSCDDGLKLLYLKKDFIEASGDLKKFYREKELEYVSDELNNLYVAFTRAEEELYIFLTDRVGQANRLIPYLFALEPFQSFTSDERITIGERRKRTDVTDVLGSSGDAASFFANFTEMPGWTTKLRTRLSDMDSVSRHAILARKKGNAIHRALSLIQFLPVDKEMIAALARAASAHEGIEDQSAGIESVLRTFFATPSFATFFTPGPDLVSWNEKEIVDGNGNTFKIDRIVAGPDRVDIIDYKTGETHCESHFEQIRHYGKLIAEALPAKEIRLHLLYIDDGRVVEA